MTNIGSFNEIAQFRQIKTGFYFAKNDSGKLCVRILHEQVYFITKDDADDHCYDEYIIESESAFLANQDEEFVRVTLAPEPSLNLHVPTEIYVHPDCFEFVCYWPGTAPSLSLSLHPDDISQYWNLDKETPIEDTRILHVSIYDRNGSFPDGRYHINKAYLLKMIEKGEIAKDAYIAPAKKEFDMDELRLTLQGDNRARALRFEGKADTPISSENGTDMSDLPQNFRFRRN
jgi:hypothetical protein